ncbi:MAG: hypothetical protein QNJ46_16640 [Leptolyngbyaceae cyanobacterium MO_188.B28]|nr:hypothetical protein [Leptolyngbyaceae cyanobacterium MO_188.B28]
MMTQETAVQSSDLVLANSDTAALSQQRLEELARTLLEFRLTSEQESGKTDKVLRRLQRQVFWLKTGLVLTVLALGGSLAGVSFLLRSDQVQLASEVDEIAQQGGPEGSFVSRLNTLESQVQSLEEWVPQELPLMLETTQTQLEALSQTIGALEQNLDQRQSVAAILANALQDLVESPSAETPSTSASQNGLTPEPWEPASEMQPGTAETAN